MRYNNNDGDDEMNEMITFNFCFSLLSKLTVVTNKLLRIYTTTANTHIPELYQTYFTLPVQLRYDTIRYNYINVRSKADK